MAKAKLIGWIIAWLGLALGLSVGILIAYMIHVQWNFFGATFVDLKTIIGLWVILPILSCFAGFYLGAVIGEKI